MFLHIIFDAPPDFTQGTIRVLGPKPDGWSKPEALRISELTAAQKRTFNSLVETFKERGEAWTATQCWVFPQVDRSTDKELPAIDLILEAVQDNTGAVATFPSVILTDPAYVKLFNALVK